MQQSIGVSMGIGPAPIWVNLFLYSFEGSAIHL